MPEPYYRPQSIAPILQSGLQSRMQNISTPLGFSQALPALGGVAEKGFQVAADREKKRMSLEMAARDYENFLALTPEEQSLQGNYEHGAASAMALGLPRPVQRADMVAVAQKQANLEKTKASTERLKLPPTGHGGGEPLNLDQLNALATGDNDEIAKAFPQGVPLQAVRFGTQFGSRKDIAEERDLKRKDKRNDEKIKMVDRFNADVSVKKAQQSIDAANTIRGLVDSNNPIAAAAVPTFMARASGEVGNLSEEDKRPFGGSRAILSRMAQAANQAMNGRLTQENAQFITELASIMEKRAAQNINNLGRTRAKQYAKASDFLSAEELFGALLPGSEYAPKVSVPGASPDALKASIRTKLGLPAGGPK